MPEHAPATPPLPAPTAAAREDRPVEPTRRSHHRPARKPGPKPVLKPPTGVPPSAVALPVAQLDVLKRQQERIRHCTEVIAYVLTTEHRNGSARTLGDALTELLADINDAVQTIGTILHPGSSRRT